MLKITEDKKEQKRIAFHEKNIESSKSKIWKYEQKMSKTDISEVQKYKLQNKIDQELHFIEIQKYIIEDPNFEVHTE